jgi:hypothetical protein
MRPTLERCHKCGKPKHGYYIGSEQCNCKDEPLPKGWECPRCGKIHSPYSLSCDCYPKATTKSTTTGTYFTVPQIDDVRNWVI